LQILRAVDELTGDFGNGLEGKSFCDFGSGILGVLQHYRHLADIGLLGPRAQQLKKAPIGGNADSSISNKRFQRERAWSEAKS
jgi:hypothetical protein